MEEVSGASDFETDISALVPDLILDPEQYRAELDGFKLTEAQKRELFEILCSIMRIFVELGYSVDVGGHMVSAIFQQAASELEVKDSEG